MNEFNSTSKSEKSQGNSTKSQNAPKSSTSKRKRHPRETSQPNPCAGSRKGRKGPPSGGAGGTLPGNQSKCTRPSCRGRATQSAQEVGQDKVGITAESVLSPLGITLASCDSDVPGVVPHHLTEPGGDCKWKCSLTPRVLRAHDEMGPLARRRYLKLLRDFGPRIRNARSHEEREMIMDRLAVAAVTFRKNGRCKASPGRTRKRQGKAATQGRRTCRNWAATQVAWGTRDLPSSSTRWKVREAYLKFVEKNGFTPGDHALMSLTGLSAKKVLGVLPGIEQELGFNGSAEPHELSSASSSEVLEEVTALDLVENIQKILAEVEAHDRILWVLRFVVGYGPDGILRLLAKLRGTASLEAVVPALERLVAEWPSLTRECRELKEVEALLQLSTSEQVRCRLCRLNNVVRDRLKALDYRA